MFSLSLSLKCLHYRQLYHDDVWVWLVSLAIFILTNNHLLVKTLLLLHTYRTHTHEASVYPVYSSCFTIVKPTSVTTCTEGPPVSSVSLDFAAKYMHIICSTPYLVPFTCVDYSDLPRVLVYLIPHQGWIQ